MSMSPRPALPQHRTNKVPLPMPCTTPVATIHRSPLGCTRASLASRLRAARLWWWAGPGWQRTAIASTFCPSLCLQVRKDPPGDVVVRHITFNPHYHYHYHLPRSWFLVIKWPHLTTSLLTNHYLPVIALIYPPTRDLTSTVTTITLFSALLVSASRALRCSAKQPAVRHGLNSNRRSLRTPI